MLFSLCMLITTKNILGGIICKRECLFQSLQQYQPGSFLLFLFFWQCNIKYYINFNLLKDPKSRDVVFGIRTQDRILSCLKIISANLNCKIVHLCKIKLQKSTKKLIYKFWLYCHCQISFKALQLNVFLFYFCLSIP